MNLGSGDFPAFYKELNGYEPFPWQRRLVHEVVQHDGLWPAVIELPTSAGKTSAIDVAVFLLALQVREQDGVLTPVPLHDESGARSRTAPLRTFFVVDRRIVVDEAGKKATSLAKRLNDPKESSDIVRAVADRLRSFNGGKALHVSVLRGGMYRDGSWAEAPNQPTICLSTVDQIGSRLLFRGYGVSPYQRAVHAGLVGNDALILVDEAHLSGPFVETLKAVEFYRSRRWASSTVKTPFQVVVMSATAGSSTQTIRPMAQEEERRPPKLKLEADDFENDTLHRRVAARKLARLEEVKGGDEDEETNRKAFADILVGLARELAAPPGSPEPRKGKLERDGCPEANVIGIVVNRVDTARRVHSLLTALRSEAPEFDAILLTGRVRPYDRDRLLDTWLPYIAAQKERPAPPRGKLFVVATQAIECGANISFDALVTEAAPIDALRQRFGRLDRLGLRGESQAIIVARKDLLRKDDPIYGTGVRATWDWLSENRSGPGKDKRIDFGINALQTKLPSDSGKLESLRSPSPHAPVMMPAHVDDWVQTTVPPVPDPSPELFLHGPLSGPADVSVVWRADVTEDELTKASEGDERDRTVRKQRLESIIDAIALVPPMSMEALPLPVWSVSNWLRTSHARTAANAADFSDLEGEQGRDPSGSRDKSPLKPFLRWRGPDANAGTTVSRDPGDIRPGDTVVVPSGYGGCDCFGWNPELPDAVQDVADDCSWRAKRRPVLRIHPASSVHSVALHAWTGFREGKDRIAQALMDQLPDLLTVDPETEEPDWDGVAAGFASVGEKYSWLKTAKRIAYPGGKGMAFVGRWKKEGWPYPNVATAAEDDNDDAPADGDGASFIAAPALVELGKHCSGVRDRIEGFSQSLGLDVRLARILSRAAALHDAGKADPRFQLWLYGGEVEAARHGFAPIAKSPIEARNAAAVEAARRRAGWPKGARHEALSVLLVRNHPAALDDLADPNLAIHLIGTHHGHGRPLWRLAPDDELPSDAESPTVVEWRSSRDIVFSAAGRPRPESTLLALHAGWVDSFWEMVSRYGWWGLAYLEMLLVLADHQQSEAEEEG